MVNPLLLKAAAWIAGGGAAAYAGYSLFTKAQLSSNLVVEKNLRIHTLTPLVVAVDVKLKNPSQGTIRVNHPMVSLFTSQEDVKANAPLVSSDPQPKDYQIPRSSTIVLDPILLRVPVIAALNIIPQLLDGRGLTVFGKVSTLINNVVPYNDFMQQTLIKPAA